MKSADKRTTKNSSSTATGFTIIESVFVIIAIVVISFILAGLYVRSTRPAAPSVPAGETETLPPAEAIPAGGDAPEPE
jgi:hypothetical protein